MDTDFRKSVELIKEEIALLQGFNGGGYAPWGGGSINGGNLWQPISGGAGSPGGFFALYYWIQTAWFNRWQRYMGRYLYFSNGYAVTAINNLTILALGVGFHIQTPNKSKQVKIDQWMKDTDYRRRSLDAFRRYLTDGEVFYRIFDNNKIRFIDPDYVYSSTGDQDLQLGVWTAEDDYEEVEAYQVHRSRDNGGEGERVPVAEIQHRKSASFGARRGYSWLLPIATDLFQADRLTNSLLRTADLIAKFAFFRKHEANQAGVQAFKDTISSQPQNIYPTGGNGFPAAAVPRDSVENYADGSIVDLPTSVTVEQLKGLANGQGYTDVLNASLRKIAARMCLPMGVFGDRDERGAYAAEMVSNSYLVRSIEALQEDWKDQDLKLLEMCGFDISDITIEAPQVNVIDSDQLIAEMNFLMSQGLCSKHTAAEAFGMNFEDEQALIKSEPKTEVDETNPDKEIVDPTDRSI